MAEVTVICAHESLPDRKICCDLDWSVERFKKEISQLYESQKPDPGKMRIICSGQLLQNPSCLKDVLRSFGPDHQHVVHLVYTDNINKTQSQNSTPVKPNECLRKRNAAPGSDSSADASTPSRNADRGDLSGNPLLDVGSYASLAQQGFAANAAGVAEPQAALMYQQMQQMYSVYVNNYINYLSQIYGGVYMGQMGFNPASMASGGITPVLPPGFTGGADTGVANNDAAAGGPQDAQPPQAPPQGEQVMNAQGGLDEEDVGERDWLDYVYMACRAGILVMVLFFYSSLERFAFVLIIFALAYAYQNGLFHYFIERRRRENMAHNQAVQDARMGYQNAQGVEQQPGVPPEQSANPTTADSASSSTSTEETRDSSSEADDGVTAEATVATPEENPNDPAVFYRGMTPFQVFWRTCAMFITTFFTSLFPDNRHVAQVQN